MTEPTPTQKPIAPATETGKTLPSPLRCLVGALIAGGLAIALYFLTSSIAQAFAAKPIQSDNVLVWKITIAVRTLVVGISTLGTGVFGFISVGLVGLAIQILVQRPNNQLPPPSDT